ncbi:beta-glucosidase [Aspergillus sclerotioniger CBS 115572]|uniref:beta-glucosidase n=1 Tax=Aspergillus sclerotioniger CBS 115572 TaxID=1450535 RepID=A0A317WLE3_9EURO|nr:beta-glucosidase [Aspergillus sclerotioniger CBS 115572]PWY85838.1 beta-glucosidase [Aspergillus sclerotioniger CBS 115572]
MVAGLLTKGLLLLQLASGLMAAQNASRPLYKNPNAPVEARVSDLLGRMTVQDKMAQLIQGDISNWMDTTTGAFNYTGLVENMDSKAGMFYVGYAVPWDWLSTNIKRAQDYLLQNTTLGIPALVQTEGIHGFLLENATIYNSPIGYACSFNTELVQKMGRLIAQEARAVGATQLFAPLADLARELRYGRVEETFSEDSYLAGEMAYSYIKGLQSLNVSATVKHFVGYSLPEQGLNTAPVQGGERYLRSTWLPSFKRAIVDAGVWSVMSAYHAYDGIPAVADWYALTKILREEWGYKYWVFSDSGATDRLCTAFKLCRSSPIDMEAVTMMALPAGNDVEMGGGSYNFQKIPELVESGQLDIDIVNTAVSRVLRAKFEMGLFENPYPAAPQSEWSNLIHTPEAIELARTLDKESIVLLENHNTTLPLKKSGNIAVLGPMAHGYMNYGDYVIYGSQWRGVTPLDGIKAAVGDSATIHYAQGCERWSNDESGFDEAIAAAKKSDVAIVVVGTWSRDQTELWENYNATTGEHVDLDDLSLVGAQGPLIRAIRDTGIPTIVVLSSGKPLTDVTWISNSTSALLQHFYPSEQGGNALADVLFGDYNPSGKLSVSFPHFVGDLPIYYDYLNSARNIGDAGHAYANGTLDFGHQYVLGDPHAVYPFGYGKSYSSFEYSNLRLSKTNVTVKDTVSVSVDVKNLDQMREATEVVQVYVVDEIASVVVANRLLKGFEKVVIPAGGSKSVTVDIKVEDLGLWNVSMKYVVEKGAFGVLVGSSSLDIRGSAVFYVE